jgi:hypothetical protein
MPTLDIAMPLALFLVVTAAVFLNTRAEGKLKASVETKEVQKKDMFLLVVTMAIVISIIAITTLLNPENTFENVLLGVFLGSYTMLLFTFSYIFSELKRSRAQLLSIGFGIASVIAGAISLVGAASDRITLLRVGVFFGFAIFCFAIAAYEQKRSNDKKAKWYIAAEPPALFLMLYLFFNLFYGGTASIWFPVLWDLFGATFAILIILYLSPLFNWKTVGIFAGILTLLDIILVFSGPMVAAANTFTGLGLPVLIYLPNVPIHLTTAGEIGFRGLGLGDFFFCGVLAVQMYHQFGKKISFISIVSMALAFGIWEVFLPEITKFFGIGGFPATVCLITGWLPIAAAATYWQKKKYNPNLAPAPTTESSPPPPIL